LRTGETINDYDFVQYKNKVLCTVATNERVFGVYFSELSDNFIYLDILKDKEATKVQASVKENNNILAVYASKGDNNLLLCKVNLTNDDFISYNETNTISAFSLHVGSSITDNQGIYDCYGNTVYVNGKNLVKLYGTNYATFRGNITKIFKNYNRSNEFAFAVLTTNENRLYFISNDTRIEPNIPSDINKSTIKYVLFGNEYIFIVTSENSKNIVYILSQPLYVNGIYECSYMGKTTLSGNADENICIFDCITGTEDLLYIKQNDKIHSYLISKGIDVANINRPADSSNINAFTRDECLLSVNGDDFYY
jgi:hypothetical protein